MEIVDEATWPSERLSVYISAERRALDRMAVRGGADDQPRWSVRRNGGERCVRPPESSELFVGVRGAPRISLALRTGYGGVYEACGWQGCEAWSSGVLQLESSVGAVRGRRGTKELVNVRCRTENK